jgi:glutathione synthase/RimK-type ligase-like ATP-grasp enzyme
MQKVLILICWQPEDGPTVDRYKQYAQADQEVTVRRLDSFFASWNGSALEVTDIRGEITLEQFDAVYFSGWQPQPDMAYAIAHYLHRKGITFTGKTILELYPGSKTGEMVRLVGAGIPYPKSYYTTEESKLAQLFDWAHEKHALELPIVLKASNASKGEHNHLFRSREELAGFIPEPGMHYLMQEAIPNDSDYRVLVIGGQVQLVIQRTRTNTDSHLNNTSQGAAADVVPKENWPEGLEDLAVRAAEALGREDIAGVDVLINKETGEQYVLEVNKTPHMSIGAENVIETKLRALFAQLAKQ